MVSSLEINEQELKNIRSASELTGYSRDYITKLAREQKIIASQIGRQWFVDVGSLSKYAKMVAEEQALRNQQLSETRRLERQALKTKTSTSQNQKRKNRKTFTMPSQVIATGVLFMGVGFGFLLNQMPLLSSSNKTQVASNPLIESVQGDVTKLSSENQVTISGVNFSHESVGLSTLDGSEKGILLLPQESREVNNPSDFFSDDVKVMVDENGNKFVARLDENGEVVEKIPFVVVPVTSDKTP